MIYRQRKWAMVMGVLLAVGQSAGASDVVGESSPRKWYESMLPEELPALVYPKYFSDVDEAKRQVFSGRYKLALQTISHLKKPADVALMKGQALAGLGRFDEALATLTTDALAVQVERARVLAEMGKTRAAIEFLKSHLGKYPNSLAGHFEIGKLFEEVGDFDSARAAYGWFVDPKQDYLTKWKDSPEKTFESAEDATTFGRALDRWATLTGAYQTNASLNDVILDIFVKAYDVIDREYWPAHVAAAEYFLSHDNAQDAQKELKEALGGNPNNAYTFELFGGIAESQYDFDTCDGAIDRMRKSDANSARADLLQVRNLLRQRRPKEAGDLAKKILARKPNWLPAMALQAAAEALQLHTDETKKLLAEVDKVNPHDATAYYEVAEQLGAMRQYPRSAEMYKVAIERAPWWTAPRNGLGLLYTQSGEEDLARSTLDAAHLLDPYNVATTNYLRVMDELGSFGTKESAHFIVMYDKELDPIIPEYFNDYLESTYSTVTSDFKTEPAVKTIIEVFPTHDAFSVRTTGSPWIGTVGASTGRIIAMVAPRKGENTMGAFNWSQVLRHEFTHTVTLAATDNRISHWMTEGLAVYEEHSPLQWPWVPMLYRAVTKHQLFDMDALTWAFVRPKKATDRQMAYAESFWVCTYIEQRYGHDAILKMLADFKAGQLQDDVFPAVLGRPTSQFFSEFQIWAGEQVKSWGYDAKSQKKYDALRDKGAQLIESKKYVEAVKVWEEIAALRPVDQLPHLRLAGLYLAKSVNDPGKAIEHLKILHQVDLKDDRYAKRIARIYRDGGDLKNAQQWGLQAVYIDPYDTDAHELLMEVCKKAEDQPGVDRETRVIAILKDWTARMKQAATVQ